MARQTRRFGMGDLMILIAAIGAASWSTKSLWLGLTEGPLKSWWPSTPARLVFATMLSACAMPMTLACIAFRLRQPRPPWRRLSIQPGASALIACSMVFAARMLEVAAAFHSPTGGPMLEKAYSIRVSDSGYLAFVRLHDGNGAIGAVQVGGCFSVLVASYAYPCGYAVAATWLVLATSGRWRPEKSWIDRLGRVLGIVWISITILTAPPWK
jgi:hypothetical protein